MSDEMIFIHLWGKKINWVSSE